VHSGRACADARATRRPATFLPRDARGAAAVHLDAVAVAGRRPVTINTRTALQSIPVCFCYPVYFSFQIMDILAMSSRFDLSASEVTTIWRYTNVYIIIIIIMICITGH